MLDWNLGEQEAAITMHADQKAVASDLDVFRVDGLGRGKDAEFNFQVGALRRGLRGGSGYLRRRRRERYQRQRGKRN